MADYDESEDLSGRITRMLQETPDSYDPHYTTSRPARAGNTWEQPDYYPRTQDEHASVPLSVPDAALQQGFSATSDMSSVYDDGAAPEYAGGGVQRAMYADGRQPIVDAAEQDDAGERDYTDETETGRLETITHALLFFLWIGLVLSFSHWNHVPSLLCTGTLLIVSAVAMYDLFMRRSEHRAVQTLLIVWSLWLLYSVLAYSLHVSVRSLWIYGVRDSILTLQIILLVGFRMLPTRITQTEYGAMVGRRFMDLLGHDRVNAAKRAAESLQNNITHEYPARLSALDNGTTMRMGKELERDCFSFRFAMRQNMGVRFLSSDSRAGFILYQMLIAIPFVQNSAVGYNTYWSVARLAGSFVLYKIIDAVFRPRVPGSGPQVSAPTIVSLAQFPLYAHPYLMAPATFVLLLVFSCVCYSTHTERLQRAADDGADNTMAHFDQDGQEAAQGV